MSQTIGAAFLAVLGVVLAVLLGVLVFSVANLNPNAVPPGITVTGDGRAQAAPDVAEISIGVVTTAATAAEALTQNSTQSQQVIQAIRNAGIPERDIQTQGLSVQPVEAPRRNPGDPLQITGYRAQNTVEVTVRELADNRVGVVVDAANRAGANVTGGIRFRLENDQAARQEALTEAIENARQKAEAIARASGKTVRGVRAVTESGVSVPVLQRSAMAADAAQAAPAPPVQSGELTITARVTVVFE